MSKLLQCKGCGKGVIQRDMEGYCFNCGNKNNYYDNPSIDEDNILTFLCSASKSGTNRQFHIPKQLVMLGKVQPKNVLYRITAEPIIEYERVKKENE